MTFKERLESLGFRTYQEYLKSTHWIAFKTVYRNSGLSDRCIVCDGQPIQLHHHDYTRLGSESLDDVTPMCGECHTSVHAILKKARRHVGFTEWAIERLKGVVKVKRLISKEERYYEEATEKAKSLSSLRSAYVKFYASVKKQNRPPTTKLKRKLGRQGKRVSK